MEKPEKNVLTNKPDQNKKIKIIWCVRYRMAAESPNHPENETKVTKK